MKAYYILSVLSVEDKNFFFDTIKDINSPDDIDAIIKRKYYRVDKKTVNTTYNSITLETWLFIKQIWLRYDISPNQINWVYRQNMVILNDDLWLSNWVWKWWEKVSWEKDTYFFTSRYSFRASFWAAWDKISQHNPLYPKLVFPNKEITLNKKEKIRFIVNAYEKREEIIGDFMLPLLYTRNTGSIRDLLNLWKQEVGSTNSVMKKSWATDNGKHITWINVDECINNDQKLDYLFLKYISRINEFDTDLYFTDYFEIDQEFRLYYSKNLKTNNYTLYSVKQKVNLTWRDEILSKANMRTWQQVKVKWSCLDKKDVSQYLDKIAKHVMQANKINVWVIEFIRLPDGAYRFLEINCLGGSMMFEGEDEKNIKTLILNWWDELFLENVNK